MEGVLVMIPKACIGLASGGIVDVVDFDPAELCLSDIAQGIERTERWSGQLIDPVNVCQHSVAGARCAAARGDYALAYAFLWHDVGEFLWRDMPTLVKRRPEMAWYRDQEKAATKKIATYFAPCADLSAPAVKQLDLDCLVFERLTFGDPSTAGSWFAANRAQGCELPEKPTAALTAAQYRRATRYEWAALHRWLAYRLDDTFAIKRADEPWNCVLWPANGDAGDDAALP